MEHDEARTPKRPKKEFPKSDPPPRHNDLPPNRSSFSLPILPPNRNWFSPKKSLVRRTSPNRATSPTREISRISDQEEATYKHYTPLNVPRDVVYLAIRDKGLLKKPVDTEEPGKSKPSGAKPIEIDEDDLHPVEEKRVEEDSGQRGQLTKELETVLVGEGDPK
ncbi:hypothetical protein Q3G72_012049 [Acer saccharum]|nr:hypothetical protein Q3G72_012049 [Acer saccharum]